MVERRAIDETDMGHAARVTHGERLSDSAADAVSDEARAIDAKLIEQCDRSLGVRADVDWVRAGPIAASVAEEIEDDQSVSGWHQRDDVAPQMARGREAVKKNHGYAGAARSCGVVVEPRAAKIEKLTAHAEPCQ
jgi:hypothetical protein